MILNDVGNKVEELWKEIPKHFVTVDLDYFVVMPNHIHGIIIISPNLDVETGYIPSQKCDDGKEAIETPFMASLQQKKKKISISIIIGTYKAAVKRWCNQNGYKEFLWQERFYDRIIRNEKELFNIRQYISNNPLQWDLENETPENLEPF